MVKIHVVPTPAEDVYRYLYLYFGALILYVIYFILTYVDGALERRAKMRLDNR